MRPIFLNTLYKCGNFLNPPCLGSFISVLLEEGATKRTPCTIAVNLYGHRLLLRKLIQFMNISLSKVVARYAFFYIFWTVSTAVHHLTQFANCCIMIYARHLVGHTLYWNGMFKSFRIFSACMYVYEIKFIGMRHDPASWQKKPLF